MDRPYYEKRMKFKISTQRIILLVTGMIGLLLVYLFQNDIADLGKELAGKGFWSFALGRAIRFILNDIFALLIIFALFYERKYIIFAIYVQLAGMVLILFPYLILKYHMPGYNGPLISFLHRLVLNPLLLLLLIPAFWYQRQLSETK